MHCKGRGVSLALVLAALVGLGGCRHELSPAQVVGAFGEAAARGDREAAMQYLTERSRDVLAGWLAMSDAYETTRVQPLRRLGPVRVESVRVDVDRATVRARCHGRAEEYVLVREAGAWRIDLLDLDRGAALGRVQRR